MAHTDVIPTSASIASTGLGIRYLGNYCYAYSGEVDVSTSNTILLDFTTGAGLIRARFQYAFSTTSTADVTPVIKLNDVKVFQFAASQQALTEPYSLPYVELILPPVTRVECSSVVSGGSQLQSIALVGRVYGAE